MNIRACVSCPHYIHHLIAGNYGVVLCRYWKTEISPRAMAWSYEERDYFIFCPSEFREEHRMPAP